MAKFSFLIPAWVSLQYMQRDPLVLSLRNPRMDWFPQSQRGQIPDQTPHKQVGVSSRNRSSSVRPDRLEDSVVRNTSWETSTDVSRQRVRVRGDFAVSAYRLRPELVSLSCHRPEVVPRERLAQRTTALFGRFGAADAAVTGFLVAAAFAGAFLPAAFLAGAFVGAEFVEAFFDDF